MYLQEWLPTPSNALHCCPVRLLTQTPRIRGLLRSTVVSGLQASCMRVITPYSMKVDTYISMLTTILYGARRIRVFLHFNLVREATEIDVFFAVPIHSGGLRRLMNYLARCVKNGERAVPGCCWALLHRNAFAGWGRWKLYQLFPPAESAVWVSTGSPDFTVGGTSVLGRVPVAGFLPHRFVAVAAINRLRVRL